MHVYACKIFANLMSNVITSGTKEFIYMYMLQVFTSLLLN